LELRNPGLRLLPNVRRNIPLVDDYNLFYDKFENNQKIKPMTPSNTEIKTAKELKVNFQLIILGIVLSGLVYLILYISLYPPTNAPVPEEVKSRIRNNTGSASLQVGDAFSTHSKYDVNVTTEDILEDNINENRVIRFKEDINSKIVVISPILILVLILGRYLLKTATWVDKTAKLDTNE